MHHSPQIRGPASLQHDQVSELKTEEFESAVNVTVECRAAALSSTHLIWQASSEEQGNFSGQAISLETEVAHTPPRDRLRDAVNKLHDTRHEPFWKNIDETDASQMIKQLGTTLFAQSNKNDMCPLHTCFIIMTNFTCQNRIN